MTMTLTVIGGLLFLALIVVSVIARRECHTKAS
jgi:hypothetical protein